ncbi:MAG TPA: sialidase family protein [Pyrinomonadaceae bacterium]|nr:sialidase family protein [Pyrinomonadaceae bacterium]
MTSYRLVNISSFLVLTVLLLGCNRTNSDPIAQPNSNPTSGSQALIIRPADLPATGDSREPDLTATADGRVILSWVEKVSEKRYALRMATRDQASWSEPRTVGEGENWFVNWADFPSVISLNDGSLAAHWLVKSGTATYAYNVNIALSKDGGKTWSKPIVPHLDNTQTEHGFVSLVPLSDGHLGAIWLDGRNMKAIKDGHDESKPLSVSMTLRYAAIDANGKISEDAQLDERVCECCQTSATVTSDGVFAAYRDRSQNEVRDIYSVRQAGGSWGSPQTVHADNWEINGCPVNGPSVAAEGRNVAVAWFTGAGGTQRVKIAFSSDGGATFAAPIQIDEGETQGRVDMVLLPDKSALVCWLSGTSEGGELKVRRVDSNGSLGPPAVIAKTDISRSSGFPRMARLGNEVHIAWTEFGKPSRIRMATTDISAYK